MTMGVGKGIKITALLGVKRHHTRFYPIDANSKDGYGNNNCNPGTYVDRTVTSPYFRDFYLQSHSGIKGTARPTHYFVLRDDGIASCTNTANLRKLVSCLPYLALPGSRFVLISHFIDSSPVLHLLPSHDWCLIRCPNILCRPSLRSSTSLPPRYLGWPRRYLHWNTQHR